MNEREYYEMIVPVLSEKRFERKIIQPAQDFVHDHHPRFIDFSNASDKLEAGFQDALFNLRNFSDDSTTRSLSDLCLRCYISHSKEIALNKFIKDNIVKRKLIAQKQEFFLRKDLQTILFKDTGKLFKFYPDNQNFDKIYPLFSLEILQGYNLDKENRKNLKNWTILLTTRKIYKLQSILNEYNIYISDPWKYLKRIDPLTWRLTAQDITDEGDTYMFNVETIEYILMFLRETERESKNHKWNQQNKLENLLIKLDKNRISLSSDTEISKRILNLKKVLSQIAGKIRNLQERPVSLYQNISLGEKDTGELISIIPDRSLHEVKSHGFDALDQQYNTRFQEKFVEQWDLKKTEVYLTISFKMIQCRIDQIERSYRVTYNSKQYIDAMKYKFIHQYKMKKISQLLGFGDNQPMVSNMLQIASHLYPSIIESSVLPELKNIFNHWVNQSPQIEDFRLMTHTPSLIRELLTPQIEEILEDYHQALKNLKNSKASSNGTFLEQSIATTLQQFFP